MNEALSAFGWDADWEATLEGAGSLRAARVLAVHYGGSFLHDAVHGRVLGNPSGTLAGLMRRDRLAKLAVGDWVLVDDAGSGKVTVHSVLPRRNSVVRRAAGEGDRGQLLCANVHEVFVVTSADSDWNMERIDRYLRVVSEAKVPARVIVTKADLLAPGHDLKAELHARFPEVPMFLTSSASGEGLASMDAHLRAGCTYALLGSSGVGKSTLVNRWLAEAGSALQTVGEVRESDGKGRHTTTHRELFRTLGGALVIDTPGMREVGVVGDAETATRHARSRKR